MDNPSRDIDVSVIIVTYNAEAFINDCLLSLRRQSFSSFETILVDNGSADRTLDIIEKHYPWVKLVCSAINTGFTGGVQLGYKVSRGKYIVLLNPDTQAHEDWLSNLVLAVERDDRCGICASLMLKWGTKLVDTAGDGCTRAGKGYKIGNNEPAVNHQKSREVFAACGGAALYRREMIEEIGFFDEDFFLLHEDTDLSFRARLAGWKCLYVHNAVVEHKVSATIGFKTSLAVYHSVKNSDQVWLKNMPGLLLLLTLPEKIASDSLSFFYLGIVHKRYREYFKAKMYTFSRLFRILRKRSRIQHTRIIKNRNLLNMLTSFFSFNYMSKLLKEKKCEIRTSNRGGGSVP